MMLVCMRFWEEAADLVLRPRSLLRQPWLGEYRSCDDRPLSPGPSGRLGKAALCSRLSPDSSLCTFLHAYVPRTNPCSWQVSSGSTIRRTSHGVAFVGNFGSSTTSEEKQTWPRGAEKVGTNTVAVFAFLTGHRSVCDCVSAPSYVQRGTACPGRCKGRVSHRRRLWLSIARPDWALVLVALPSLSRAHAP